MDPQASSQFIASLIKSIQVVCHGNVEFNHNIEIVGHIYLHVDKCQKFNYVLNEEVLKDSESTKFVSNSFPAEPPSRETDRKRRKVATPSSVTESDGATDLISMSNDADELSSRLSHPPAVSSASPTVVVPSTPASSLRHRPRRPSFPASQSALSSSESERTPPPRTVTTSQSQALSQPQTRVPGPGVLLDSEVKPDVSGQTTTSLSHPPSSRDSYVSSDPSLSGAGAAVTTTHPNTSEPDIQIKLEVPSEEEVQLLSHDIAGQVRGSSHPSHSGDPNSSPGSGSLYPVMLHQNLAAARESGAPSGSRAKRQHLESDIPVLSSAYSIGQDDFNLHSSNLPGSSNKQPGSQWNHPPQRMLQDPPNDGIAEPMVHFDTSMMGPRLSGGPTSTVTSMAQDSSSGSLEARDAQGSGQVGVSCPQDPVGPSTSASASARINRLKERHFLEPIPVLPGRSRNQRACIVCYARLARTGVSIKERRNKRKMTQIQCAQCVKPLCAHPCFMIYHTQEHYDS